MANHEITFDRFGDRTVKVASDNFSFTILYHELYTGRYFVHQSEFLVISDYWKVTDIRLVRLNDKDYIEYKGARDKRFCRLTELNDLLEYNCYASEEVSVVMVFDALMCNCRRSYVRMRLIDIFNNYK